MQVERKWHVLFTIFLLLITSGHCMDSKEVKQKERKTLLDLILQVIRDSQQRDRAGVSRRCNSGHSSGQDGKFSSSSSSSFSSSSSREKPFYVSRLDNSRLIEIVPRDVNMKGKFIQHFTAGPVKFSSECRTHFHRLYHNTRDCSRPACSQSSRSFNPKKVKSRATGHSSFLEDVSPLHPRRFFSSRLKKPLEITKDAPDC